MSCETLTIGATGLVTLDKLTDNSTGGYVNDATVSGTLYESDRTTSLAAFSLTYVTNSNGKYQGTITAATTGALTAGNTYRIKVTGTSGGNTFVEWLDALADY